MATSINLQVRCRPESLRELRAEVDTLEGLAARAFDVVKLIANELASNSIQHSDLGEHDQIEVAVETRRDHVRVDVHDSGAGFVLRTAPGGGGLGLPMVQRLSREFGISHTGHTHAWAEISLSA